MNTIFEVEQAARVSAIKGAVALGCVVAMLICVLFALS